MYDTNNKRSLDLSEYKKQRSLKFWKLAHFCLKTYIKRTKCLFELKDQQVSVQNVKLYMRWNKTLTHYSPAVMNNQSPNSGSIEISLLHS